MQEKNPALNAGESRLLKRAHSSVFKEYVDLCCVQPDNRKKQGAECKQRTYER